jgi:hypothetical protein
VLISRASLEEMKAGRVDRAFRRWKRPTVRAGGTLRTSIGLLAIDSVEAIGDGDVTEEDARRAGFASREALFAFLPERDGQLYRIRLRTGGVDPRAALRERPEITADERADLRARLGRMDARAPDGAWTRATLEIIAASPATRAADLAASLGRERLPFKADVRKLKALGLTESLERGYRLSPRGQAFLAGEPRA